MAKKIATALLSAFSLGFAVLFTSFLVWANTDGQYRGQIEACLAARKPGGAGARTITDYVCPDDQKLSDQDAAYQVTLDLEMQKLDKTVRSDLRDFQKDHGKDVVAKEKKMSDWFDDTAENPKYAPKYRAICNEVNTPGNPVYEVVHSYSGGVSTDGNTASFVQWQEKCDALVDTKLSAYRDIARLVALDTTVASFSEDRSDFTRRLKKQYQNFLMEWAIYIGKLATIKDKWPSKTRTTQ